MGRRRAGGAPGPPGRSAAARVRSIFSGDRAMRVVVVLLLSCPVAAGLGLGRSLRLPGSGPWLSRREKGQIGVNIRESLSSSARGPCLAAVSSSGVLTCGALLNSTLISLCWQVRLRSYGAEGLARRGGWGRRWSGIGAAFSWGKDSPCGVVLAAFGIDLRRLGRIPFAGGVW